ncbi:GGDEF domain-containing protein [Pseudomonas fragi]|uniref:diguanylate cyclase n=1 Tax=Pseudomonas fragi TaxID=296 RepID=A0A9Q6YD82_PSEFR|nr:GGDEF domain-containing protein [Pseudomonas fragi]QPL29574.1 GGDEF domain-containing protein [Pseudomonas fragi]
MQRPGVSGAILLIDNEDEGRFYQSLAHHKALVVPSPSVASELLGMLKKKGIDGVAAIVKKTSLSEISENEFFPDSGDVASILLDSSQLNRVMINIAGKRWVQAADSHVQGLTERCRNLGNQLSELFKGHQSSATPIDLVNLINWNTLELKKKHSSTTSDSSYLPLIANHSKSTKTLSPGDLALEILASCTKHFKPDGISCDNQVSKNQLSQLLEVSFNFEDLEDDSIFWRIRAWERQNQQHPLLNHWRILDAFGLVWDQRYWEKDIHLIVKHENQSIVLCLMKLDLDNFKNVNDKLGHAKGDDAIKLASIVIKKVLGATGEVYRRGGDEFIIISPMMNEANADQLAESLRKELETSFEAWGHCNALSPPPTASIGVANMSKDMSIPMLISLVDSAQKSAKELGKNRVYRASAL